jgi:hypothetical protein
LLIKGLKIGIPVYILCSLVSSNGCLDSYRIKETDILEGKDNPVKVFEELGRRK